MDKVQQEQLLYKLPEANGVEREVQEITDSIDKEKLHLDLEYQEKIIKCEVENKQLLLALDEANEKNRSQEQEILRLVKELESVKEASQRGYMLAMLEEEKRDVDEQLKWKTEQFGLLEEAHVKLRDKFQSCRTEFKEEKAQLLEEISRLQASVNSQSESGVSMDLRNQLEMCSRALLHEEQRRKRLEVEIAEMKLHLEDVTTECEEAKSLIECKTNERTDETSALRNSLRIKATLYKEMEYKAKKLEQENRELLDSLKQLQEAEIPKAYTTTTTPSSLAKRRSKLKNNLEAEKIAQELNDLKLKDVEIGKLKVEIEGCHSSITQLKLQNEELSLMLQLLRSEFSAIQARDDSVEEQLALKDAALVKAQNDLEQECEKHAALLMKVEALKSLEQRQLLMQEELEKYKDVIQVLNSELEEKIYEGCDLELDLQVWKSKADNLKTQLEVNRLTRRDLESSLLTQAEFEESLKQDIVCLTNKVDEKDRIIADLQQHMTRLAGEEEEEEEEEEEVEVEEEEDHEAYDEIYPPKENVITKITSGAILDDRLVLRVLN
ncbi:hypothetical protein Dimus_011423 [Dionaea muscipula]